MSYAEQIFLAEEIARQVSQITYPSPPSQPPIQQVIKTEEIRPTKADIINHNLTNANQWYEIKLSRNIVTWQITVRGNHEIKYSYSPTHATFRTLRAGEILEADTSPNTDINAIYVMSTEGGVVVELEFWEK